MTQRKLLVGIDIGGTKTAVVLSHQPPDVLARAEFATRPAKGPQQALNQIKKSVRDLLAEKEWEPGAITRVGVSCGGPLDRVQGIIQSPPNLPTWENVPL